ncbi:NAD-dependent epimerase/dehydratase family protein [Parasediminibacterium sp. JCM 36343]|uniref:NAD-dependent epimerase/dehydratase family protein n=1 Tax=Parasediminibacterium sp. JCM 36343 TaxID=3374279 RepID=UPI00397CB027
MRLLVTGATGFIGGYVVHALLKTGHRVIATSSSQEKAEKQDWFSKVTYIALDLKTIDNSIDYYSFFEKPDCIIHLAWEGLPNYKSLFHFEENLPRHYVFLKNLVVNGAKDITVTGTCFEYGMIEGCLIETMLTQPENPYALAKDCLRKYLEELRKMHPFSLKWPRLFYMYGKGQNQKSILPQLDMAIQNSEEVFNMSGGQQVRDYLPVEHVAANIVSIALQKEVDGIVNCASGIPITVKALVEDYIQKQNASIKLNLGHYPYPDYEPMRFWGGIEKLNMVNKI